MMKHKEVVAFTCGLLPDPSPLVDLAYMMLINVELWPVSTYNETWTIYPHTAVLLESLYRESNIPLPGHHFRNQFINYYERKDNKNLPADTFFSRHIIYRPSRVYAFFNVRELQLGEMNRHHDITESIIYIIEHEELESPKSILHICCRISENQPIAKLAMYGVTILNTTELCPLKISEKNFRIELHWIPMPSRVMVQLMELISQASRVDFMMIEYTSLVGVKSFNLENKAASLLHLILSYVEMDSELCTSLMKQIPSLINLRSLHFCAEYEDSVEYCHIPTDLCPEIFRSISHFHHMSYLDVSGNNLSGCLPNFLSYSHSVLPSLQDMFLMNTALTVHDVNHIIHIIETGKLPNLAELNLAMNNLDGMESEIDRLLNVAKAYPKLKLLI